MTLPSPSTAEARAVEKLHRCLPEFEHAYSGVVADFGGPFPHAVFGALARWIESLLQTPDQSGLVGHAMAIVEEIAEDAGAHNLLQTGFLEVAGASPETLRRLRPHMGSRTRQLSDEIETFWDEVQRPNTTK